MKTEVYCQICNNLINTYEGDYQIEYITCNKCNDETMRIKISQAMKLARDCKLNKILILGISEEGEQTVVTFGETLEDSVKISELGNWFKKQLGWPEDYCDSKPVRIKNK